MTKHLTLAASALMALGLLTTANAATVTDAAAGHAPRNGRMLRPHAPSKPVAYGSILSDGTVYSGTSNFTATWDATNQWYAITITGIDYYYLSYSTNMSTSTPYGTTVCQTDSVNGQLLARCYGANGAPTQAEFSFTTF
jgi:hypothetical protein